MIPIGFHWDGEHIVICTATTAPKVRALSSRPEVAVTINTGSTPSEAKSLQVRGTAAVEIVDGVPGEYLAASRKTLDAEQVEMFEHQVRLMYEQMARISIAPQSARFYDFGAGRFPSFLSTLASEAEARARVSSWGTDPDPKEAEMAESQAQRESRLAKVRARRAMKRARTGDSPRRKESGTRRQKG